MATHQVTEEVHVFPAAQAAYLRAMKDGRYRSSVPHRRLPREVSLVDRMPPVVYHQSLRGTCVANAVVAMLECYWDCRTRLSVQFLHAAAKDLERTGLERNLERIRSGEYLDPAFENAFRNQLRQLKMLSDANGGIDSPVVKPYLQKFADGARVRLDDASGSLLRSCFKVVETQGVCRYALWPYAAAQGAPAIGAMVVSTVYPPGAQEDAMKRRVVSGLYLLGAPNNVDEIRGILAGANGRRPMPVCVTVDIFDGCDGDGEANGLFSFPDTIEGEDGRLAPVQEWRGRHGLLLAGYKDDASFEGGGYFVVRNSFGTEWGDDGYGKMPYAYLECFALEAGTILQNMVDYAGDGYDGMRPEVSGHVVRTNRARLHLYLWANIAVAGIIVAVTWTVASRALRPRRNPFVEVTVYGMGGVNETGVLPPWNVKGTPIDGGYVYSLPAKDDKAVDDIRKTLGEMKTLHEKRGKPLTYDLISLFLLKGDDRAAVKRAISEFMGEGFPVRIREDGPAGLKVATLNPRGLKAKLSRVFSVEDEENDTLWLKPHVMK